jgi:hypothetical protein
MNIVNMVASSLQRIRRRLGILARRYRRPMSGNSANSLSASESSRSNCPAAEARTACQRAELIRICCSVSGVTKTPTFNHGPRACGGPVQHDVRDPLGHLPRTFAEPRGAAIALPRQDHPANPRRLVLPSGRSVGSAIIRRRLQTNARSVDMTNMFPR